jgi:excisionase family DNA binding protein
MNDHRVSVSELAALLQVSTDTIRRAYRKGELPHSFSTIG